MDRKYLIFPTEYVSNIDFSTVCETSTDTLRHSVDGTMTFVKWDDEQPECTKNIPNSQGPYTHKEILEILSTEEWSAPMEYPA